MERRVYEMKEGAPLYDLSYLGSSQWKRPRISETTFKPAVQQTQLAKMPRIRTRGIENVPSNVFTQEIVSRLNPKDALSLRLASKKLLGEKSVEEVYREKLHRMIFDYRYVDSLEKAMDAMLDIEQYIKKNMNGKFIDLDPPVKFKFFDLLYPLIQIKNQPISRELKIQKLIEFYENFINSHLGPIYVSFVNENQNDLNIYWGDNIHDLIHDYLDTADDLLDLNEAYNLYPEYDLVEDEWDLLDRVDEEIQIAKNNTEMDYENRNLHYPMAIYLDTTMTLSELQALNLQKLNQTPRPINKQNQTTIYMILELIHGLKI
jgi:hypothetical protein